MHRLVAEAKELYADENLQIDDDAATWAAAKGDDGMWVEAWVWVPAVPALI